jgi:hypothetical protein
MLADYTPWNYQITITGNNASFFKSSIIINFCSLCSHIHSLKKKASVAEADTASGGLYGKELATRA